MNIKILSYIALPIIIWILTFPIYQAHIKFEKLGRWHRGLFYFVNFVGGISYFSIISMFINPHDVPEIPEYFFFPLLAFSPFFLWYIIYKKNYESLVDEQLNSNMIKKIRYVAVMSDGQFLKTVKLPDGWFAYTTDDFSEADIWTGSDDELFEEVLDNIENSIIKTEKHMKFESLISVEMKLYQE